MSPGVVAQWGYVIGFGLERYSFKLAFHSDYHSCTYLRPLNGQRAKVQHVIVRDNVHGMARVGKIHGVVGNIHGVVGVGNIHGVVGVGNMQGMGELGA